MKCWPRLRPLWAKITTLQTKTMPSSRLLLRFVLGWTAPIWVQVYQPQSKQPYLTARVSVIQLKLNAVWWWQLTSGPVEALAYRKVRLTSKLLLSVNKADWKLLTWTVTLWFSQWKNNLNICASWLNRVWRLKKWNKTCGWPMLKTWWTWPSSRLTARYKYWTLKSAYLMHAWKRSNHWLTFTRRKLKLQYRASQHTALRLMLKSPLVKSTNKRLKFSRLRLMRLCRMWKSTRPWCRVKPHALD